jgi:hypothetical protein
MLLAVLLDSLVVTTPPQTMEAVLLSTPKGTPVFPSPATHSPSTPQHPPDFLWRLTLAGFAPLWQAVGMAKKRTKVDNAQRQADQLEKRADTRPEQTPKKSQPKQLGTGEFGDDWPRQKLLCYDVRCHVIENRVSNLLG